MRGATETLEQDAQAALMRLREALGRLFAHLPGPADRAHQLQDLLGIDKKLAWRVHSFVHDADVMAGSRHLPSSSGMAIVVEAALGRGVAEELADEARAAFDGYQDVIRSHAGERAAMEMMLAAASPKARHDAARTHQRSAFKANSFIWGAQARVQLSTLILHPSETDSTRGHIAAIRGLAELRRIRPHTPWVIGRVRCIDDDGKIRAPLNLTPIDPQEPRADGLPPVPLLRDFCSKPTPTVQRVAGMDRHLEDELVETPIGNLGAVSCFTGELARDVATVRQEAHNTVADMVIRVRTPLQWLLVDVFTHREMRPTQTPWLRVYSDISAAAPQRADRDLLPIEGEVQQMGTGAAGAYTPLLPEYPAMLRHVFGRLGWDASAFEQHRVLLEYPVMPSSVHVGWPLPGD